VKESLASGRNIRQVAIEKASAGALRHRDDNRPVSVQEITAALGNMRRLTEGGIVENGASG